MSKAYDPSPLTARELDGASATLRFLRHLAKHLAVGGTDKQMVENCSFDSATGTSALACDVGIVECVITDAGVLSEPRMLSWTGDIDELLKAVPTASSSSASASSAPPIAATATAAAAPPAARKGNGLFLPLTSCVERGLLSPAAAGAQPQLALGADPSAPRRKFMYALVAVSREGDAETAAAARAFVDVHGQVIVTFLRAMARYPTTAPVPLAATSILTNPSPSRCQPGGGKNELTDADLEAALARLNELKHKSQQHQGGIEPPRSVAGAPSDVDEQLTVIFEQQLLKRRVGAKKDQDHWDRGGRDVFKQQLHRYTGTGRRLLFMLPCMPFKSSNTASKVLGDMPDMGEYLAIKRLDDVMLRFGEVYPPGAQLVLFSDGRVYCDLFRIDDETTSRFKAAVRRIYPAQRITWSDLDEFFADSTDTTKRVALEALFGATPAKVIERIDNDPDFRENYTGFKGFLQTDLTLKPTGLRDGGINSQLRNIARGLMGRNFAYGCMMRVLFREHIRFSIHPSSNGRTGLPGGAKFSVSLVGASDWGTPWHNCALRRLDGSWELIRRSEAEQRGYSIERSATSLPYYVETSTPAASVAASTTAPDAIAAACSTAGAGDAAAAAAVAAAVKIALTEHEQVVADAAADRAAAVAAAAAGVPLTAASIADKPLPRSASSSSRDSDEESDGCDVNANDGSVGVDWG